MWMSDYVRAVKRGFRDQFGIKPTGGTKDEPLFKEIPDGIYPMRIGGKREYVVVMHENQWHLCLEMQKPVKRK